MSNNPEEQAESAEREVLVELIAQVGHKTDFKGSKYLNDDQNDHDRSRNEHAWRTVMAEPIADAVIAWQAARSQQSPSPERDIRQEVVGKWCADAFGVEQQSSISQRGVRMLEEAIETAQACDVELDRAHKLLDYVYGRPIGDPKQELGGLGLTVLALANALRVSADDAEKQEVERVLSKPLAHFAQRNQAKNEAGFLQVSSPAPSSVAVAGEVQMSAQPLAEKPAELPARPISYQIEDMWGRACFIYDAPQVDVYIPALSAQLAAALKERNEARGAEIEWERIYGLTVARAEKAEAERDEANSLLAECAGVNEGFEKLAARFDRVSQRKAAGEGKEL